MDIIDQLPEYMRLRDPLKSSVFQPKRISLNSQDDTNIAIANDPNVPSLDTYRYNNFTINLQRPALNAKSIQLLRATMPTPITNIPDDECVFWYYRLYTTLTAEFFDLTDTPYDLNYLGYTLQQNGTVTNAVDDIVWTYDLESALAGNVTNVYDYPLHVLVGTMLPTVTVDPKNVNSLFYVRLLPSYMSPTYYGTQYGYNRTFTSYQDLVNELNKAAAQDRGLTTGINPPYYVANDVVFGYDATYNKITFKGLNAATVPQPGNYNYIPVAYDDPVLQTPSMLSNFASYTIPTFGIPFTMLSQPVKAFRPLQLRMGWTYNGYSKFVLLFNQTLQTVLQQANSYCDLVNSQDVYVYIDFIGGGTLDSAGNGGLLSVIPLNTVNNGVAFYNNVLNNPITRLPEHISEIRITLLTDTGDPFYLPNNAITNLEIGFSYYD